MSQQSEQAQPAEDLEQTVASFLEENPEFFNRNPELLERLEILHQSHGITSLVERQVKRLRATAEEHKQQLQELIAVAHENELINQRLHRLTLTLLDAVDFDEAASTLQEVLYNDFEADAVELHMRPNPDSGAQSGLDEFGSLIDQGKSWCGQLELDRLEYLFGTKAEEINSTALIPLSGEGVSGVLAIGSGDQQRFHPHMGTEYLTRLGEIISKTLEVVSEQGS
jgi:uncharacterized protein YigA (DUF484 family)